jgi:hypothetical protein
VVYEDRDVDSWVTGNRIARLLLAMLAIVSSSDAFAARSADEQVKSLIQRYTQAKAQLDRSIDFQR